MQMVRCAPSHQPTRFPCSGCCCQSVISPMSPQFMAPVPWPQALGFGAWERKPVTHRVQNALWNPESCPLHLPFPICFFPEALGKLCFSWYL